MKVAVMGAGAVGGYFGGLLARSGEDVTFIARGEHRKALEEKGLTVKSVHGDFSLKVNVALTPMEVDPVDLVLFCVKAYDTDMVSYQILPMVTWRTTVLTLQNGVDNAEKIEKVVGGPGKVMPGVARIEATVLEPGVIGQMSQFRDIEFGEWDGTVTPKAEKVFQAFQKAGIPCQLSPDIRKSLWTKLLFISAFAGMTTLTGGTIGEVMNCRETRELYISLMREVEKVARAKSVNLDDDVIEKVLKLTGGFSHEAKSSMQRDLEKGKQLEIDALHGIIVKYGKELSIPTPVNETIYGCLKLIEQKRRATR
ncbi:MAG: 2-dehydropantoate 2-reductase [Candidatus Tectomicrobia bacterium]|nr:2-dehydropantoate 2-reductase [Candidatus Tectomicrobia bacterium]